MSLRGVPFLYSHTTNIPTIIETTAPFHSIPLPWCIFVVAAAIVCHWTILMILHVHVCVFVVCISKFLYGYAYMRIDLCLGVSTLWTGNRHMKHDKKIWIMNLKGVCVSILNMTYSHTYFEWKPIINLHCRWTIVAVVVVCGIQQWQWWWSLPSKSFAWYTHQHS